MLSTYRQIFTLFLLCTTTITSANAQQLSDVLPVDDSFKFEVRSEFRTGICDAQVVRLTSQTWQKQDWEHWLTILVPDNAKLKDAAILFISGGSSRSRQPDAGTSEVRQFLSLIHI